MKLRARLSLRKKTSRRLAGRASLESAILGSVRRYFDGWLAAKRKRTGDALILEALERYFQKPASRSEQPARG